MKRRDFLKGLGAGLSLSAVPGAKLYAAQENYSGKLFINYQARGGWDTTNFCDPKTNVPGQPIVTKWAETQEPKIAGNIPYAPFGQNDGFFNRHYQRMMVINGINMKTNSHPKGQQLISTGHRNAPSLSALFAFVHSTNQSMPWLIDSQKKSWSRGIVSPTSLSGGGVASLITPEKESAYSDRVSLFNDDVELVRQFTSTSNERYQDSHHLPRTRDFLKQFTSSSKDDPRLLDLADRLKTLPTPSYPEGSSSDLIDRIGFIMASFKTGLAVSADLGSSKLDTHVDNDERQQVGMGYVLSSIDYIWQLAEYFGIADRLVVSVVSDFSRTPYYNNKDGKDHWSVGSCLFMENNAPWTNKVHGGTTEALMAKTWDVDSLQESESGVQIEAKHVAHAAREYLGLNTETIVSHFPLTNELMPFFS